MENGMKYYVFHESAMKQMKTISRMHEKFETHVEKSFAI
jgi:hypothetical protein